MEPVVERSDTTGYRVADLGHPGRDASPGYGSPAES